MLKVYQSVAALCTFAGTGLGAGVGGYIGYKLSDGVAESVLAVPVCAFLGGGVGFTAGILIGATSPVSLPLIALKAINN